MAHHPTTRRERLNEEQQEHRLGEHGVTKAPRPARPRRRRPRPSFGPRAGGEAFQKGLQALTQYIAREVTLPGRAVVERLPDGTEHRTGIRLGNRKARRDKLYAPQSGEHRCHWPVQDP